MKPIDTITTLFSHNQWANLLLLERCADLTTEQRLTGGTGTYGSIQDTLEHIVSSEQSYFSRIFGLSVQKHEDQAPWTIAEMMEVVRETGDGLIASASKVQAEDTVQVNWAGTPRDVPKTTILTQVINHATEHRAQIMMIMTQLGIEPPDLDSWTYFDESEKKKFF